MAVQNVLELGTLLKAFALAKVILQIKFRNDSGK